MVYTNVFPTPFSEIPSMPIPQKVLLCSPDYYDIVDVKNVHMEAHVGDFDKDQAWAQWTMLKDIYFGLKTNGTLTEVSILEGQPGLEDMVYAANQTFPWLKNGDPVFIPSLMRHESRKKEVPFYAAFFKEKGYQEIPLKKATLLEGMGDLIPLPGKKLLFGGYGYRTELSALEEVSELLEVDIIALKLVDDRFYHLDTCFIPLNEKSVLLYKPAFDEASMELLHSLFENIVEIPEEEAENFALNAHVISTNEHKVAILQKKNRTTKEFLVQQGFEVFGISTSEFIKSGGSVFCMKMMYF